jgi:two-component system sensor histidine kinase CiaH
MYLKKIKPRTFENKQRWGLFFKILLSFAILFLVLGGVIYFFFQRSIYQNIDSGLNNQKRQIMTDKKAPQFRRTQTGRRPQREQAPPANTAQFRTMTVVYNKKGQVINSNEFLNGLTIFTKIPLEKSKVNKKETMTLYTGNTQTSNHYFRKLLVKVPKENANTMYAGRYVLLLENIDSELLAINSFRKSLMITLASFWILAIAIAYYLSRQNMKPILRSWKRQQEFSSNAAHELRTPLTVIQNQMEFLLTKPRDQVMDHAVEVSTTLDEVKHMKVLSSQLLTLARSDSGMIQINKQEVDIEPWLNKVIQPFGEIADSQNKVLNTNLLAQGRVNFDADLVRQLLVILLDNALKYTPSGGSINVSAKVNKKNLVFEISDTGRGIDDPEKEKIFDCFYRTDKSRNSKTGGNGLGLSIAKWIVDEHHGKISVYDNYPTGTIFKVVLPE